jgi:hypothetical protein
MGLRGGLRVGSIRWRWDEDLWGACIISKGE